LPSAPIDADDRSEPDTDDVKDVGLARPAEAQQWT
jgi:hypothetical protein